MFLEAAESGEGWEGIGEHSSQGAGPNSIEKKIIIKAKTSILVLDFLNVHGFLLNCD